MVSAGSRRNSAPGERRDERHAGGAGDRLGRGRGRCADLADQREDLVLADQALGVGDRCLRLVAVVEGDEFELPAADAAGGVGLGEGGSDAALHLDAEFGRRSGESRRLAEDDAIDGDAVLGRCRPGKARRAPERIATETRVSKPACPAPMIFPPAVLQASVRERMPNRAASSISNKA